MSDLIMQYRYGRAEAARKIEDGTCLVVADARAERSRYADNTDKYFFWTGYIDEILDVRSAFCERVS